MKRWNILGSVAAAAAAVMLMAFPVCAQETTLPEGIYVGDVSLGGLTQKKAEQEIQALVDRMAERKVVLEVEGVTAETTAQELGFFWSNPDALDKAAEYGTEGNLIQRYMALKDLEKDPVHIPFETEVDQTLVEAFIDEQCRNLPGEPKNAAIRRENGEFVITEGTEGIAVDVEAAKKMLDEALKAADDGDVRVEAPVTIAQPKILASDLESIRDVLGTFSTDFSSSGAARSKNLQVGSAKINGHVLMPGETLSGYECMQPFTTDNGYYTAAAYENGQVVDSVGGGVCQIATTLYNAALRAELEITQRQNHSMLVGYVKPSMDAAIAGTYKDIKITNNYSTPIYVEGGTSGRTLTFTIYGKETRPENREVSFESKTISVNHPGDPKVQLDPTMAPGSRKQVQSAHTGMKSELWKVVKVNGVETERTRLNQDTYMASKAIVLVGPAAPAAAPAVPEAADIAAAETGTEAGTPQPEPTEGENGGPGVTAAAEIPAASPVPAETPAAPSPTPVETAPVSPAPVSEIPAPPEA
ncbi:MAG: VanW family protein [Brotaphodocola sp.]